MSVVRERAYLGDRPKRPPAWQGHHRDLPALRAGPDVGKGCKHSMAVPACESTEPLVLLHGVAGDAVDSADVLAVQMTSGSVTFHAWRFLTMAIHAPSEGADTLRPQASPACSCVLPPSSFPVTATALPTNRSGVACTLSALIAECADRVLLWPAARKPATLPLSGRRGIGRAVPRFLSTP